MAIDAKELRIGNMVMFMGREIFVHGGTIQDLERDNAVQSQYEPIPLTTEILLKCGFDVKDDNPKQKEQYKGDVLFKMCGFEFTNCMKEGFICYEINEGKTVYKSMHQLQNLYYALTNSELNISL